MHPVFLFKVFFPEFSVCDVAYSQAALIRAGVPRARVFLHGVSTFSRPFFFFVFFHGGLFCLRGLRVCPSSIRFAAKCVAGASSSCRPLSVAVSDPRSHIQVVASCVRGILASGDPFTSATLVGSSVAVVRLRLSSTPFCGLVRRSNLCTESVDLRRLCTAVLVFRRRFRRIPLNTGISGARVRCRGLSAY